MGGAGREIRAISSMHTRDNAIQAGQAAIGETLAGGESVGRDPQIGHSTGGRPHPVFWVIAAALVAIATAQFIKPDHPFTIDSALAQGVVSGGARGVFAFSGQLSKNTYGVYIVDVDAMTMWMYEYQPQKGCMRLAAARSWRYDRYLENHNLCDLPPDIVEQMVAEQRKYRLQESESEMP